MSAPIRSNRKSYLGSNPTPTNDTDPIGGAINTSTGLINPATIGSLFSDLKIPASDTNYYSAFYIRFEHSAAGSLQSARIANRAGARPNTSSGTASVISTSTSDTGIIRVVGKISGSWDYEDLTLTGTTTVIGSKIWDSGSVVRWESTTGVPVGAITCSVSSYVCAVMYGTGFDPTDGLGSIAPYMCSAEIQLAPCTAKNTTISSSNRLTAPTTIGSFANATSWTGTDSSISVPSGFFDANDYIGVAVKFTAYANIIPPSSGRIQFMTEALGSASSSN